MLLPQLATTLSLAAGLATAVHIRYYPTSGCSGANVFCSNIEANRCCRQAAVSILFDLDRTVEARGFSGEACGTLRTVTQSNGQNDVCMTRVGNWLYTGGLWRPQPTLRLRGLPDEVPGKCAADGGSKCESWSKPDVLALADGTEYRIGQLNGDKYDEMSQLLVHCNLIHITHLGASMASVVNGTIATPKDAPEVLKSVRITAQ